VEIGGLEIVAAGGWFVAEVSKLRRLMKARWPKQLALFDHLWAGSHAQYNREKTLILMAN
jgi:hypothetical protein